MDIATIKEQVNLLCKAIKNKQRISFLYGENERIGEPQCCGVTTAGNEAVRIHLLKGGSRPEQLFDVSRMKSLKVLDEYFTKPGPNYNPNDSVMEVIHCRL